MFRRVDSYVAPWQIPAIIIYRTVYEILKILAPIDSFSSFKL